MHMHMRMRMHKHTLVRTYARARTHTDIHTNDIAKTCAGDQGGESGG